MAFNSSTVTAGDTATATQYNNVRKDVVKYAGDQAVATGSSNAFLLTVDSQFALVVGAVVKFVANFSVTGATTINVNGTGAIAIKKAASVALSDNDIRSGQLVMIGYDGTNWQLIANPPSYNVGDGSDGALNVASGTTTVNPTYKALNYTSFNVASGATLTFGANFLNKPIAMYVQGDFVLAGTIELRDLGAPGSSGGAAQTGSQSGNDGADGTNCVNNMDGLNHYGVKGLKGQSGTSGTGGAAGAAQTLPGIFLVSNSNVYYVQTGPGGGSGGSGASATSNGATSGGGGKGGNGGGALVIFVGGNIDVTGGVVNISGRDGDNASAVVGTPTGSEGGGGGGGAGAAGMLGLFYRGTLTGSLTITATNGSGGTASAGVNGANTGRSGGNGGAVNTAGSAGAAAGGVDGGGGGGGGGARSYSVNSLIDKLYLLQS